MEIEDQEFKTRVTRQLHDLWAKPELERRKAAGLVPSDFRISRIQVIFDPLKDGSQVRFNEEVRCIANIITARPFTENELMSLEDPGDVHSIRSLVLDESEADCGHITAIPFRGAWFVSFDLRCNSRRIEEICRAVPQFIESASRSLERQHLNSFVECLWSAVELMAKGFLLSTFGVELARKSNHSAISARFNLMRHKGLTDGRFAALNNKLQEWRPIARYLEKPLTLTAEDAEAMLNVAKSMLEALQEGAPKAIQLDVAVVDRPSDTAPEQETGS